MKFYKEDLLDHYHHPRNYGKPEKVSHESEQANPSCGDSIQIFLYIQDGIIQQIGYQAQGCVLSIAAASKLSEHIKYKSQEYIHTLPQDFMQSLMGIQIGINRMQCIMLSLQALKTALK